MSQSTTPVATTRRRLDPSSLALLIVGLVFGAWSYGLATDGANPLILVPSVVAATVGATHLVKREALREGPSDG